jgi:hypothetical protein
LGLKSIFYDLNPKDVIRAFIQVDPKKLLREREEQERRQDELNNHLDTKEKRE